MTNILPPWVQGGASRRLAGGLKTTTEKQIAIKALAGQGEYGIITNLSRENEIHRGKIYKLREHAQTALDAAFAEDTLYEQMTGIHVEDWLTLLGYPPSEKSAKVAAWVK